MESSRRRRLSWMACICVAIVLHSPDVIASGSDDDLIGQIQSSAAEYVAKVKGMTYICELIGTSESYADSKRTKTIVNSTRTVIKQKPGSVLVHRHYEDEGKPIEEVLMRNTDYAAIVKKGESGDGWKFQGVHVGGDGSQFGYSIAIEDLAAKMLFSCRTRMGCRSSRFADLPITS